MPHLRLTGATPEVDTLCAVASALEGDDASDKYRAHSRRDLQMLSPLATREVTGSLGRQLWMKQKDAMIAKVRTAGPTLVCFAMQSNAVPSQEYMHLARAALTPAVPLACAPAAATGGTARRSRPTLEHIQHLAS
jgi:hypothetical protein